MTTSEERIVRYTAEQLDEMARRGESQTDWARVEALTEEQLANSIDYEDEWVFDHSRVYAGPFTMNPHDDSDGWHESIYLKATILDGIRDLYPDDFRGRINDVLREWLETERARQGK